VNKKLARSEHARLPFDELRLLGLLRQVMVIERLPHQRFDDCLPADIEIPRGLIKLLEHRSREVDVDTLDHAAFPIKEAGNILPLVGEASDCLGGDRLGGFRDYFNRDSKLHRLDIA